MAMTLMKPFSREQCTGLSSVLPAATEQTVKADAWPRFSLKFLTDVSFGSYRGMHVMVSLNTKHNQERSVSGWLWQLCTSCQGGQNATRRGDRNSISTTSACRFVEQYGNAMPLFCLYDERGALRFELHDKRIRSLHHNAMLWIVISHAGRYAFSLHIEADASGRDFSQRSTCRENAKVITDLLHYELCVRAPRASVAGGILCEPSASPTCRCTGMACIFRF
jgi:hypothetical protein